MRSTKSKMGLLAAIGVGLASSISPTIASNVAQGTETNAPSQSSKRDAVVFPVQAPKPVENRLNFTNGGTGKDANRFLNQRQYRKWIRQNPHMRRSKKCRIKS